MVSELLQDRPRLVKQMGNIIFILVCKWIFKFQLGYLNYHQRSTLLQSPSRLNRILWKLLPKEATAISSYGLSLLLLVPVAKPSQTLARLAQRCVPLEVLLLPKAAWDICSPVPAPPRCRAVQCWKSRGGGGVQAAGLLWLHPLVFLPSAGFVPVINSQTRKDLNSWSSTQGLSGQWWLARAITEGERETGHFRKDVHLKTCPCWRNAWERPKTQQTSLHFCSSHYFFCKSLTYRHTGQVHFPFLRV